MTKAELEAQIMKVADAARLSGAVVEIDHTLPTVAIELSDSTYFFQEQSASELLDTIPEDLNVSDEAYLLWSAQGW